MSLFRKIGATIRRRVHARDIDKSLERYRNLLAHTPDTRQSYADAGTFRSQVDRLFALGNTTEAETEALQHIAQSVVSSTVTNRFYRAADYLSDILDDLERDTYLTGESAGEPPLSPDREPFERELKLKAIREAWLVPLKVGSIEACVSAYGTNVGRLLPYAALQRFERLVARLFALVGRSERTLVEERMKAFVVHWREQESFRARFHEPATAVALLLAYLCGARTPNAVENIRRRRSDQPLRLSTAVAEDRQHYLLASLDMLEPIEDDS